MQIDVAYRTYNVFFFRFAYRLNFFCLCKLFLNSHTIFVLSPNENRKLLVTMMRPNILSLFHTRVFTVRACISLYHQCLKISINKRNYFCEVMGPRFFFFIYLCHVHHWHTRITNQLESTRLHDFFFFSSFFFTNIKILFCLLYFLFVFVLLGNHYAYR